MSKQIISLAGTLQTQAKEVADDWRAGGKVNRLWQRDKSLWTNADEDRWLGWLDSVGADQIKNFEVFADEVHREQFKDVLLIGMGGSSLGPEVLAETFGQKDGWPRLRIIDSTVPAQIEAIDATLDLGRTLFIVSSKSGSTTEPNALKDYFYKRVADTVGAGKTGRHFVAITDPGSSLEKTAKADGFRQIFFGVPSIGGRYSVLSPFGLVPAAAAGIDVARFVASAQAMMRSCGPDVPLADNPGVALGIALGVAGREGRDKVTLFASPSLASFGAWAEQLIAEFDRQEWQGPHPRGRRTDWRAGCLWRRPHFYRPHARQRGRRRSRDEAQALERAGHPVIRIAQNSAEDIGQEFFRFEIATAVAGAIMGINPFDQPDVEASKIKTRELTAAFEKSGALPAETPAFSTNAVDIYTDAANAKALRAAGAGNSVESWLKAHFARLRAGDYVALLAYIARDDANAAPLQKLRLALRDRRRVATCLGFGPRFLHSTGQAYKGGPDSGVFLQITSDDVRDLPIPGHRASFGVVKAAQARGDFGVLVERGRRAMRVHLKGDVGAGLKALETAAERALT